MAAVQSAVFSKGRADKVFHQLQLLEIEGLVIKDQEAVDLGVSVQVSENPRTPLCPVVFGFIRNRESAASEYSVAVSHCF